ncbi:hypothetical protein LTR85_010090 [Meristemomyces frigidus]|nr:hypothetical protein LTR85_010090 [Meristemomyces frigidus]
MDSKLHQRLMSDIMNEPFDPDKDYDVEIMRPRSSLPEYGEGINKEEWEEARGFLGSVEKKRDEFAVKNQKAEAAATVMSRTVTQLLAMNEMLKEKLGEEGVEAGEQYDELAASTDTELVAVLPEGELEQVKEMAHEVVGMDLQTLKVFCKATATDRKRLLNPHRNPLMEAWEANGRFNPFTGKPSATVNEYGPDVCGGCGAVEGEGGAALLQCVKCKGQKYCSKECQKKHWKAHKRVCSAV